MPGPKKVLVKPFGCQMNVYDSERISESLKAYGFSQTETLEEADLVVLNTCHIREKAADKVYSFAEVGAGQWSTTVDVSTRAAASIMPLAPTRQIGTPSPVAGNLQADVGAAVMPVPGVLVMQLARGGVPASTRIYAAAADDKSMIETATYFSNDGRPVFRTNYFSRVQ